MKWIKVMFLVFFLGILFTALYNKVPAIKNTTEAVLNPTAGSLLNFSPNLGMLVITAFVTLVLTLVQKYTIDQDSLRELKKEQNLLKEEMKKFKDNPEKLMELNKKQLEFLPKTMNLTMGSLVYTAIPILIFFRWFMNYFTENPTKFFGFMSWFWAYLVSSIIFSSIYRKLFNMP